MGAPEYKLGVELESPVLSPGRMSLSSIDYSMLVPYGVALW